MPRTALVAIAVAAVATLTIWPTAAALECEGIQLDDGCLFTITGGDTPDPDDGYAVTNADGVPLYDFVRERDLNAIGYPISQRWTNGPFTFQAFQKVILQWDRGNSRMNYYNTLDVLANRYPEVELPNVPPHLVLQADEGADFATIKQNHLLLLDQNLTIKERFLSEPDWLNLYGLPIRYEEREAEGHPRGLMMLRAQRTVFVIWNVPAPGITVGRVNLQNVPDKVKKLSNVIIPDAAKSPVTRDAVAGLPAFTLPAPTPTPAPTPAPPPPPPAPAPGPRPEWLSQWQVLVDFYHATGGPNWTTKTNWLSSRPVSEWHGVVTTGGKVTELQFWGNNLRGTIPWQLGYLPSLRVLNLSANDLTGGIPPELARLSNLTVLNLSVNELSGAIPDWLANRFGLTELDLAYNNFSGTIPHGMGRLINLERLALTGNQFSGTIPDALGSLSKLTDLGLAHNQLQGPIPPVLGHLTKLESLGLNDNQLSGPIPAALGRLANLRFLRLGGSNQLTGCVPAELRGVQFNDLAELGLPFC